MENFNIIGHPTLEVRGMYKANIRHLQPPLLSTVNDFPEKDRLDLEESWAGTFYREFFCRLNEDAFAVLYADCPSRPNVPVNVLVGLDTLKAGFGWSDEELHNQFRFNLQVRYALGYHNYMEGGFELRSLYNFRQRLSRYNVAHGTNLLQKAFEAITDQQIVALKLNTTQQRMDSTQIASNILDSSRLQLAVECVQRLARLLTEADQIRYAELLSPYLTDKANQYVYRIKGKAEVQARLTQIGQVLVRLLQEGKTQYGEEDFFAVAERFFDENFRVDGDQAQPKDNAELCSGSLQSLDDLEASYRQKNNQFFKGYVANATETCHPDNPVQLLTQIQVAPNRVDDPVLLAEVLPNLVERTDLETLFTDGGFGSPTVDPLLHQYQVEQIQSAIRGTALTSPKLHLSEYELQQDEQGAPTHIRCPYGQGVAVSPTRSGKGFVAHFEASICGSCPFQQQERCRAKLRPSTGRFHLDFNQQEVDAAQRRRRCRQHKQTGKNERAAVEAAMRSLKHPFGGVRLPVRGLFRVSCMMIGSAAMVNIRRITHYLLQKNKDEASEEQNLIENETENSIHSLVLFLFSGWKALRRRFQPISDFFCC